eukprot:4597452-Amphidinium_carterae.1
MPASADGSSRSRRKQRRRVRQRSERSSSVQHSSTSGSDSDKRVTLKGLMREVKSGREDNKTALGQLTEESKKMFIGLSEKVTEEIAGMKKTMADNMSKVTTTLERHDSRFQELEKRLLALESRPVAEPHGVEALGGAARRSKTVPPQEEAEEAAKRIIIENFEDENTRDELLEKIRRIFGVSEDECVMLMKGRYNDKCTLAFNTEKKAQDFWEKHRNQGLDAEKIGVHYRSTTIYYKRKTIGFLRGEKLQKTQTVTQWWPSDVDFDQVVARLQDGVPGLRPCGVSGPTSGANFGFRLLAQHQQGRVGAITVQVEPAPVSPSGRARDTALVMRDRPASSLNSLCSLMPSVVSWNVRSLHHNEEELCRRRVDYVRRLCAEYEVVCVQETHCTRGLLVGMLDLPGHTIHASASDRSLAAGGVAAIVQSSRWHAGACQTMVPGRGTSTCTWDGVLEAVWQHVATLQQPVLMAGDWNVDLDVCDRACLKNGTMAGRVGRKAAVWRRYFDSWTDVCPGFTHKNMAEQELSCLDRFLTNVGLTSLQLLGASPIRLGSGTNPPLRSDHWPVAL